MSTPPILQLFDKQDALARAAFSGQYRYLTYGGAIRGGKTVVLLALFFTLCRIYPGSRWCLTRSDLPKIKRNLIPAFNKFKPDFFGPIHKTDWVSTAANGSQILFMPESIRDDPEGDRFRGLEVNGFGNEEANEIQEATFTRQQERVGTWHIPDLDRQPPRLIINTCNPSLGWVKNKFYNPWKMGTLEAPYFYLPARADDNPHVTDEQRQAWKDLPETAYKRFVLGDWDAADDPDQLIKFDWVHQAYEVEPVTGRQRMGIDVARFGDDTTVFAYFVGNELTEIEEHDGFDISRTSTVAQSQIAERGIGADMVAVDVVGLGAGVADNLRAAGYNVRDVVSGASPVHTGEQTLYTFKNLRSQMWWHARERLRHGEIRLGVTHQKLVDDLLAPRYKISGDKVLQVESKDDIKKRLGRSTDYGDAFVYGLFVEHLRAMNWVMN